MRQNKLILNYNTLLEEKLVPISGTKINKSIIYYINKVRTALLVKHNVINFGREEFKERQWKEIISKEVVSHEMTEEVVSNIKPMYLSLGSETSYTALDTGANVSVTKDESILYDIKRDINLQVKGVNQDVIEVRVTGTHRIFHVETYVIEDIPMDILSVSQHVRRHFMKYVQELNVFVTWEKGEHPKHFYVFVGLNGVYVTDKRHEFEHETVAQVLAKVAEVRALMEQNMSGMPSVFLVTKKFKRPPRSELQDSSYAKIMMSADGKMDYDKALHKGVMVLRRLHCGMGHIGTPSLATMIRYINKKILSNRKKKCISENFKDLITPEAVETYWGIFEHCDSCNIAKMPKDENQPRNGLPTDKVGSQLNVDVTFLNAANFFLTAVDKRSGMAFLVWLYSKDARAINGALDLVISQFVHFRHRVEVVLSDREKAIRKVDMYERGIYLVQTPPEAHNSTVEIFTRYVWQMARAIKADLGYDMPGFMYKKLFEWVFTMHNFRVKLGQETSPHEQFYDKAPNINLLLLNFGAIVICGSKNRKPSEKLTERGNVCIIVGIDPNSINCFEAYNIVSETCSHRSNWEPVDNECRYYARIEAITHEDPFVLDEGPESVGDGDNDDEISSEAVLPEEVVPDVPFPEGEEADPTKVYIIQYIGERYTKREKGRKQVKMVHTKWLGYTHDPRWDESEENLRARGYTTAHIEAQPKRQDADAAKTVLRILQEVHDENPFSEEDILLMTDNMSLNEALNSDHPEQAEEAAAEEIRSLLDYDTWDCIHYEDIPEEERKDILKCFMFLKNKYGIDNVFIKMKARLVAGGHMQDISKLRPDQISASTVKYESILTLLNVFATKGKEQGIELAIADVKCAYLQAWLLKPVYMYIASNIAKILVRLRPELKEFMDEKGGVYVKLKKALYGLVQSAKLWYETVKAALAEIGYYPLHPNVDPNVFVKKMEWGMSIIAVYVDDLGLFSRPEENTHILDHLNKRFGTKKDGGLKIQRSHDMMYLGQRIRIDPVTNHVTLSQHEFIDKMVQKFKRVYKVDSFRSEVNPATPLMFDGDDEYKTKEMNLKLMSVVMTIAYLAMRTRPDLLVFVSYLTTRIYHHDPKDEEKIKKLIGYIIHTREKVLTLASAEIKIVGLSDASYKNHPDASSQMGWITCVGYDKKTGVINGFVGATSKKNKKVCHSSAESELMAQAECLKAITHLKYFLEEIGYPEQRGIVLYQDNKSAIVMGEQGHGGRQSRHIHKDEFAVMEFSKSGIVRMEYLRTAIMVADILTKPLNAGLLKNMTGKILNEESPDIDIDAIRTMDKLDIDSLMLE